MTDAHKRGRAPTRIVVMLLALVLGAPIAAVVLAQWPLGRISELAREIDAMVLSERAAGERLAELEADVESLRAEIAEANAEAARLEALVE